MQSFRVNRNSGRDRFHEDLIDRQIDHYVSQLREKLSLLKAHFDEVQQEGETIRQATSAQASRQARVNQKKALKELHDQAGDLWNMLRYVFVDLEDRARLEPLIDSRGTGSQFKKESHFLAEQIGKAEKRITQYFFESERTISLEDLKGENMLIHLYRVREMAKRLWELSP